MPKKYDSIQKLTKKKKTYKKKSRILKKKSLKTNRKQYSKTTHVLKKGGATLEEDLQRLENEVIFEQIKLVIFGVDRYHSTTPYPIKIKINNLDEGIKIINAYYNNQLTSFMKENYQEIIKDVRELINYNTFGNNLLGRPYFDITALDDIFIYDLFKDDTFEIITVDELKKKAYIKL